MPAQKFKVLDVRPLVANGEAPFDRIRAEVDKITPGHGLTIVAPFLPAPLIELLKSEGFRFAMEHRADGAWSVNFWKE